MATYTLTLSADELYRIQSALTRACIAFQAEAGHFRETAVGFAELGDVSGAAAAVNRFERLTAARAEIVELMKRIDALSD